jgi:hypothetical protein
MRRRDIFLFLTGAVIWPAQVRAQQSSSKAWRVAFLYPGGGRTLRRRELITLFGGVTAASAWPRPLSAQGKAIPAPLLARADEVIEHIAPLRHADCVEQCPRSGAKWKTYARTEFFTVCPNRT